MRNDSSPTFEGASFAFSCGHAGLRWASRWRDLALIGGSPTSQLVCRNGTVNCAVPQLLERVVRALACV